MERFQGKDKSDTHDGTRDLGENYQDDSSSHQEGGGDCSGRATEVIPNEHRSTSLDEQINTVVTVTGHRIPNDFECSSPRLPNDFNTSSPRSPNDFNNSSPRSPNDFNTSSPRSPNDFNTSSPRSPNDFNTSSPRSPNDFNTSSPRSPNDFNTISPRSPNDFNTSSPRSPNDFNNSSPRSPNDFNTSSPRYPNDFNTSSPRSLNDFNNSSPRSPNDFNTSSPRTPNDFNTSSPRSPNDFNTSSPRSPNDFNNSSPRLLNASYNSSPALPDVHYHNSRKDALKRDQLNRDSTVTRPYNLPAKRMAMIHVPLNVTNYPSRLRHRRSMFYRGVVPAVHPREDVNPSIQEGSYSTLVEPLDIEVWLGEGANVLISKSEDVPAVHLTCLPKTCSEDVPEDYSMVDADDDMLDENSAGEEYNALNYPEHYLRVSLSINHFLAISHQIYIFNSTSEVMVSLPSPTSPYPVSEAEDIVRDDNQPSTITPVNCISPSRFPRLISPDEDTSDSDDDSFVDVESTPRARPLARIDSSTPARRVIRRRLFNNDDSMK